MRIFAAFGFSLEKPRSSMPAGHTVLLRRDYGPYGQPDQARQLPVNAFSTWRSNTEVLDDALTCVGLDLEDDFTPEQALNRLCEAPIHLEVIPL